MPEVKITHHKDGHTQEHTFHLPYDPKGEALAGKLVKHLGKVTKAHRSASMSAPTSSPSAHRRTRKRGRRLG